MGKRTIIECDVCNSTKKDTNHWFDVFIEQDEHYNPAQLSVEQRVRSSHIEIHPFDPEATDEHKVVCGQHCVILLVSTWMETGTLEVRRQSLEQHISEDANRRY